MNFNPTLKSGGEMFIEEKLGEKKKKSWEKKLPTSETEKEQNHPSDEQKPNAAFGSENKNDPTPTSMSLKKFKWCALYTNGMLLLVTIIPLTKIRKAHPTTCYP